MEKQIIEVDGKKYEVTLVPFEEVKQKRISGFYVNDVSDILEVSNRIFGKDDKNIFRTKEQAEACLALAELSQLMFEANEGWEPDWSDENQKKYTIGFSYNKIGTGVYNTLKMFLAFKTNEIAEKFLKENKELILKAKPLL